jgi:hypothetical protein
MEATENGASPGYLDVVLFHVPSSGVGSVATGATAVQVRGAVLRHPSWSPRSWRARGISGDSLKSEKTGGLNGGAEWIRTAGTAVLEGAIRSYLANTKRSTREQRIDFEEVRNWFHAEEEKLQALFSFRSICELLEIDSGLLLKELESIRPKDLPKRSTGRVSRRVAA